MVVLTLGSKGEIRRLINLMVDQCVKEDLDEAYRTADDLISSVVKYFSSRNLEYQKIKEIIHSMQRTFDHFPCHRPRVEKFFKQLSELYEAFEAVDSGRSIKDKLICIKSDLQEDFMTLCSTGNPDDMVSLSDDFRSLENLASEISLLGWNIYNKYTSVMRAVGVCQASLPKLVPQPFEQGRWRIRHESITTLTQDFGQLYPLIENLVAAFNEPILDGENVEKKETVARDLKKDQNDARASKCYNLLVEKNWSINRIAEAEGLKIEEVIDLLGLSKDHNK
jgi:hypothetical protein